ncbi:unnamed protein product [Hymenolepis diminuta]|uniref:BZIP domain-containing protein n=1 Tax=Hymenolepis diminuta TaxID=6216 RepID=A0A0R3S9T7_HYMDI|nr:unnamed protein product [Hymenolepis diminuta]VUZ47930.1 unnamed protein product [Hymenolepis diminuta]
MSQEVLPCLHPLYPSGSENCFPPEFPEASPSTISANVSIPSPNEADLESELYLDGSQVDGFPNLSPPVFCESNGQFPQDLVEVFDCFQFPENNFTVDEQSVIESLLSSPLEIPNPYLPTETACKVSSQSCPSATSHKLSSLSSECRLHQVTDNDRQSKKRKLNRDAAYRYRQKVKAHNETLLNELRQSVEAYEAARYDYEQFRNSFDALKTALRVPLSDALPHPVFY